MSGEQKTLFGFHEVARRWGVNPWTIRRLVDNGQLVSVNIGARRMIPLSEVERAEKVGAGPRKGKGEKVAVGQ